MRTRLLSAFALLLFALPLRAQVPNGGFEDWTNVGTYEDPTGYLTLNALSFLGVPVTTVKSTVAHGGTYSAENQCVAYTSFGGPDTICGLAIGQFAFTGRPLNIEGYYQLVSSTANHDCYLGVALTKWNSATNIPDTIAQGIYGTSTPTGASWTFFNLPLQYVSGAIPDTLSIIFGVNGDDGTLMRLDDLAFNGNVTEVDAATGFTCKIYPSPASTTLNLSMKENGTYTVQIHSPEGKLAGREQFNGIHHSLDTQTLANGIYLVEVSDADGRTFTRKVSVMH